MLTESEKEIIKDATKESFKAAKELYEEEITNLKGQIESMKNCDNCKYTGLPFNPMIDNTCTRCSNHCNWEFYENN